MKTGAGSTHTRSKLSLAVATALYGAAAMHGSAALGASAGASDE
jgi:hypothetical protein